jgi:hypothetical protein
MQFFGPAEKAAGGAVRIPGALIFMAAGRLPHVKAYGGRYKRLTDKTAKMLRADLENAGIHYVDDGLFFDFNAQRHLTGTLLAASGHIKKSHSQSCRIRTSTLP